MYIYIYIHIYIYTYTLAYGRVMNVDGKVDNMIT